MTSQDNGRDDSHPDPRSLATLCGKPMPPGLFLKVATAIAATLVDLHAKEQTHENLNPATILVPDTHAVTLPAAGKEPAPPYISPDEGFPNEHSQVLLNLLNNAMDAFLARKVPKPGIVITVSSVRARHAFC